MPTKGWVACCSPEAKADVAAAAASLDVAEELRFMERPDDLRVSSPNLSGGADPGVLVGELDEGASSVNVAAALVADGRFSSVVLVKREASGSLRSRAARAGIDLVIDPLQLEPPLSQRAKGIPGHGREGPGLSALGGDFGTGDFPAQGSRASLPVLVPKMESDKVIGANRRAPIVAFASGRGGVGKTFLSAAFASTAARWGMSVAAIDLDLSCGNLCSNLGVVEISDFVRALEDAGTLGTAAAQGAGSPSGVKVAGPCGRPEQAELVMPHVGELLEGASESFDLVVVDTSTTFTDAVAQAAQMADRLVLVSRGGESLASLARASGLAVRLGVARASIARAENVVNPRRKKGFDAARAQVGLEAARCFSIDDGGEEVRELSAAGRVGELYELGVPMADSVVAMTAHLLAELGCLPANDEARRAAGSDMAGRKRQWFGKRREAKSA